MSAKLLRLQCAIYKRRYHLPRFCCVGDGGMDEWAGSAAGILLTGGKNDVFWESPVPVSLYLHHKSHRTSLGLNLVSPCWWDFGDWHSEPWGGPEGCWSAGLYRLQGWSLLSLIMCYLLGLLLISNIVLGNKFCIYFKLFLPVRLLCAKNTGNV